MKVKTNIIGCCYLGTDLFTGLRAELRDKYENGDCIQLTCVHPSWHNTGITKPFDHILQKYGVRSDPASNVSDAIVEQVFASRSGQIFMPRSEEAKTSIRNWPIWLQDVAMYVHRKTAGMSL
jgi:hypothetical protein